MSQSARINNIAQRLFNRWQRQVSIGIKRLKSPSVMRTKNVPKSRAKHRIIAYDLETTRIPVFVKTDSDKLNRKGETPRPLYITAYGAEFSFSSAIRNIDHLLQILESRFLIPEHNNYRYVAWNGNNFDAFFIAAALLHEPRYQIRPYLTTKNAMRGLRVVNQDTQHAWEFLDGISMLGMIGVKLSDFLKSFAPDYQKLEAPDFEHEEFDSRNAQHVRYAERDSEGLFHGLMKAQEIVYENFGAGLKPTIGNTGITIFQSEIPAHVTIKQPNLTLLNIIRRYVMRGGFCHAVRQYKGPVWKYDINQAYAAAMRDTLLPCGDSFHVKKGISKYSRVYIARIRAYSKKSVIPIYHYHQERGALVSLPRECNGWVTYQELEQLKRERWDIEILESWNWSEHFTMKSYVYKLEKLRINAIGGPKSAQGLMMKMIGNNSYGKTVEQLTGLELLLANQQPEGYREYPIGPDDECFSHIWFKLDDPQSRAYHQPQIGAMITAHVRMVLRRAILQAPHAWLYADTDCAMFSQPVALDVDPARYGAWKIEEEGTEYRIIGKKIYANADASVKHAKGVNVRRLTSRDFDEWLAGRAPEQTQAQRQNFLKVMAGDEMFRALTKKGTRDAVLSEAN